MKKFALLLAGLCVSISLVGCEPPKPAPPKPDAPKADADKPADGGTPAPTEPATK